MTCPTLKSFLLACGLGCCAASAFCAETNAAPRLSSSPVATTNLPPRLPLPKLRSPVDAFRELLAMKLPDRKQFLTNRPPEIQKRILAKVREYESLNERDRELRLRATELRWYLMPLMSLPPTNRTARLALIPDETRRVVEDRLRQWDRLAPDKQQEFLNNDQAAQYFAQLETATTDEERQRILGPISPERRAKLQAGIDHWRGLSEDQRRKTLRQFNAFFELTPVDRLRALKTFSDAERRRMEKVLDTYASLPPEQRIQCLRSFEKYAGMSLAERLQFMKKAERWKRMSPAEREKWRSLVSVAPLPPPQRIAPPRLPVPPHRPDPVAATN